MYVESNDAKNCLTNKTENIFKKEIDQKHIKEEALKHTSDLNQNYFNI